MARYIDASEIGNVPCASRILTQNQPLNFDANNVPLYNGMTVFKNIPGSGEYVGKNFPVFGGWANSLLNIPLDNYGSMAAQLYFANEQHLSFRPTILGPWREIIDSESIDSYISAYLTKNGYKPAGS